MGMQSVPLPALGTILNSWKTALLSPHHAGRTKEPDTAAMFLLMKNSALEKERPNNMDLIELLPSQDQTEVDKCMESWMYCKSLKAVALPIYKSNTHPHYFHFQDGKLEGFPLNFNFYMFFCKKKWSGKCRRKPVKKYYCELKTLWIKFSWSLFLDLALTCADLKQLHWIFTMHLSSVLMEGWLSAPLRFRENSACCFALAPRSFTSVGVLIVFSCNILSAFLDFHWSCHQLATLSSL